MRDTTTEGRRYDPDAHFAKTPKEGLLCVECLDDNGYNTEDLTHGFSSRILLTCERCGATNDPETY